MNKLITSIMVALGITLNVFSSPCSGDPLKPCAFGYQIKIMVKTTDGNVITNCGPCNQTACVRSPATKRYVGYIFGKSDDAIACDCNEWSNAEIVLWNYDTKKAAVPTVASIKILDRIYSGDSATAEITFTLDDMTFSGFGRCSRRSDGTVALKQASGFCAGSMPAPTCSSCDCGDATPTKVWSICSSPADMPEEECDNTTCYGKWAMTWSALVEDRVIKGLDMIPGAEWEAAEPVSFTIE